MKATIFFISNTDSLLKAYTGYNWVIPHAGDLSAVESYGLNPI